MMREKGEQSFLYEILSTPNLGKLEYSFIKKGNCFPYRESVSA